MAHPINHFQLRMNNTPETLNFYKNVFGWTISSVGVGYSRIMDETPTPPLLAGQIKHGEPPTGPVIISFFNVNEIPGVIDLQTAVDKCEAQGGTLVYAKFDCPVLNCSYAIIEGPESCLFGVYNQA
jgi:predicted enzyme related to lactoylglutathione lyase